MGAEKQGIGERQLQSLLASLQSAARFFGRPASPTVLFSGTPMPEPGAVDAFVENIAQRIGLSSQRISKRGANEGKFDYPAIVHLASGAYEFREKEEEPGRRSPSARKRLNAGEGELDGAYSLSLHYSNSEERASLASALTIERPHWLLGPMKQFWRDYVNIAVAALFINSLALASPIFIKNVYDRVLPNKATSSLLALAAGVVLALVFDLILKTLRSHIIDGAGREIDQKVSYSIFEKVLNTRMEDRPPSTGEYANRISQIEYVREFFTSNTIATLIDAVFVFVFIGIIYLIGGWLFVIPLLAFFAAITVGIIAQYRIGKRVARAANEAAQRQSILVESISTIETIKSLRAEAPLLRTWSELTKNASKTAQEIKQISANAANVTQFVQQLVTILIIIFGAFEFSKGNVSTGSIIAIVMLSSRTVAPLSQIALTLARLRQATLSLRILNAIMNLSEDRPSNIGFVNRTIQDGSFSFEDVSFHYPGSDAKVINKLSFNVRSGERIGIIGKIGSGKTTIGRLLANLYEAQEGRILINGIDVRQYHPAEIRSAVAYAGQSVDLFSGTLKENLRLAKPDASDEELIAAAKKTGVDEFTARHSRGYDLDVGERGCNLSGGQKQAVAITRLLLGDPKIVFLDEPSGALDMATEHQLIGNLAKAFDPNVTIVISTHRYSLLELVDRLIVLDRGRIIADGPKDKVLDALTARAQAAAKQVPPS